MNTSTLTLLIIAAVLLVISVVFFIAGKTKKNPKALSLLDGILSEIQPIADALKPFLPGMAGMIIDSVLKYSKAAVEAVEVEFKDALSTDPNAADTRKADATDMILKALRLNGIAITEDTQKLIDAVIPLFVSFLPKTHDDGANTEAVQAATSAATTVG